MVFNFDWEAWATMLTGKKERRAAKFLEKMENPPALPQLITYLP